MEKLNNENFYRKKKVFTLILAYILSVFVCKSCNKNKDYTTIEDNNIYTVEYNDRFIYISNDYNIERIRDDESNNIYIVDLRNEKDPAMHIHNSYRIRNLYEMKTILEILKEYENKYPSNWDRSISSMELEWILHNVLFEFDKLEDHSRCVDLNNADENILNNDLVQKLIKKYWNQ